MSETIKPKLIDLDISYHQGSLPRILSDDEAIPMHLEESAWNIVFTSGICFGTFTFILAIIGLILHLYNKKLSKDMTNMENKLTKKDIKDQIDMRPVVACYRTVLNRQFSKYYQRPSCEFCSKNKENCKGENDDGDIGWVQALRRRFAGLRTRQAVLRALTRAYARVSGRKRA